MVVDVVPRDCAGIAQEQAVIDGALIEDGEIIAVQVHRATLVGHVVDEIAAAYGCSACTHMYCSPVYGVVVREVAGVDQACRSRVAQGEVLPNAGPVALRLTCDVVVRYHAVADQQVGRCQVRVPVQDSTAGITADIRIVDFQRMANSANGIRGGRGYGMSVVVNMAALDQVELCSKIHMARVVISGCGKVRCAPVFGNDTVDDFRCGTGHGDGGA